jgi:GTP-binding protein
MDDLFFRGTEYAISAPDTKSSPVDLPAIAFTGRSNSGKSSLLSALCDHRNLARQLNFFRSICSGEELLYLVDMPGYGFANLPDAERKRLRKMIDSYLLDAPNLVLTVLVLDARRKLAAEEIGIIAFHRETGRRFVMARTKWDTMNQRDRGAARRLWKEEGILHDSIPVSSTKKSGLENLAQIIRSCACPGSSETAD